MKSITIAGAHLLIFLSWVSCQNPSEILKNVEVGQTSNYDTSANLGVVFGTRSCENRDQTGKFVEWRIEGCTSNEPPCRLSANKEMREYEFDFVPGDNSQRIWLWYVITSKEEKPKRYVYDKVFNNSATTGTQLTIQQTIDLPLELMMVATNFTIRHIVYSEWMGLPHLTEICVDADFQIV